MDTISTHIDETLDNPDWEGLRSLGHRIIDDAVAYLQSVRERPAWQPIPSAVRATFDEPAPLEPAAPAQVYAAVRERILPYPTGNIHPRFWGWVMGTGTLTGAYAELLAATMNSNVSGFDDAASAVELQVIGWFKDLLGFPAAATGLLVSGASMANLVGLTVARNARAGFDVRRQGLGAAPQPLRLYASSQTHNSVKKAVELLGLGRESLRVIGVRADYTLDLEALASAIAADRHSGARPFCVVGNCGTVGTGAIDDLDALAHLCAREGLWLHVDGAFGALAALSPELHPRVRGLERADSLAFDLHKWGYMPYEAGCVLVRDGRLQREAFTVAAEYLAPAGGGVAPLGPFLADHGPQLSRSFRALKVWMSLQEHGVKRLGRLVHQNVAQATYLAQRMSAEAELELMAPVALNIVCFRYRGAAPAPAWDDLNRELLVRLQESGVAVPSHTLLEGRYALRVAITNHRSRRADFDLLVSEVLRWGRTLAAAGRSAEAQGARP